MALATADTHSVPMRAEERAEARQEAIIPSGQVTQFHRLTTQWSLRARHFNNYPYDDGDDEVGARFIVVGKCD